MRSKCLVFRDGLEWIVFAPVSLLLLRTNESAARHFGGIIDDGQLARGSGASSCADRPAGPSPPRYLTVSCSHACEQRCVYCYGTPAHSNSDLLDADFCRAAVVYIARQARAAGTGIRSFFHGVGEPTHDWDVFQQCVRIVIEVCREHGVDCQLGVCTGGQLAMPQRRWLCEHFDGVQVSIDGPADVQNLQRPRRDGKDSLVLPLALARASVTAGRQVHVKTTVTDATVSRMDEIVEFVARHIGRVHLDFGMMFCPPWAANAPVGPPNPNAFVDGFARAIDRGRMLGVSVGHPTISLETICAQHTQGREEHFCLAPPDIVTAFYDVPRERAGAPRLGAYGWYDRECGVLRFDAEKRTALQERTLGPACQTCACRSACMAPAGVRGRIPEDVPIGGPVCRARLGVLREILRRSAPQCERVVEEEA